MEIHQNDPLGGIICFDPFYNSNSLVHAMTIIFLTMHTSLQFFILFYSSFFQMFGRLLGLLISFDSPKGHLICKQTFPITFNGIGLIPTTTITLVTYLRIGLL
jgi:hypothetical protein